MKTTDMKITNENTQSIPQISKISDDDLEMAVGGARPFAMIPAIVPVIKKVVVVPIKKVVELFN